jgi:hypothetical protein
MHFDPATFQPSKIRPSQAIAAALPVFHKACYDGEEATTSEDTPDTRVSLTGTTLTSSLRPC